ncbi:MAG: AmmeMemoRadiSam system protein B [Planctomycetota bacterium]|nr:MAG: AmmeMemoRadiSam system protein B [Planctomycetota bacterium]
MSTEQNPGNPPQATFDAAAAHMQQPKLRQVRGFPVPVKGPDGQQATLLGLADARQISDKPPVVVAPAVKDLLPLMNGEHSLDQIVEKIGRGLTREQAEPLIAQLDAAGLLEGPTFDAMLQRMREEFDGSSILPPGSTAAMADALVQASLGQEVQATEEQKLELGPQKLAEAFDQWIDEALKDAKDPSFDALPKAVVAPHVDYPRGWMNYAGIWGRMRVVDRPDRVIILGTNHFGTGTGVVGCDKGFSTPLGESPADEAVVEGLRQKLGESLYTHRYDHEREHSIELQVAWIQHCLGTGPDGSHCKVYGALIHDPTVNNGESYDGNGVSLSAFVEAVRQVIDELPGKTLVVSSADLSHVGPMFGDKQPLISEDEQSEQFRNSVAKTDQDLLGMVAQNKPDELIGAMAWQGNPTRWCSVGNMVAAIQITQPDEIALLNYAGAMDPQGMGLVTHASMVMR